MAITEKLRKKRHSSIQYRHSYLASEANAVDKIGLTTANVVHVHTEYQSSLLWFVRDCLAAPNAFNSTNNSTILCPKKNKITTAWTRVYTFIQKTILRRT